LTAALVRDVWQRANNRCEYCHLPSAFYPAPFQIDHIVARQHGGGTVLGNLALSCLHCNRYKGPNVAGIDGLTGEVVRLFHPRRDDWTDHFRWDRAELEPRTRIGRVTIDVLFINDPEVVILRRTLFEEGWFPEGDQ
jgi:hypothetical protein